MNETATTPSDVIDAMNNLIEVNRDAQRGFQEASEKLNALDLKDFFREQSRARVHFVGELQPEVRLLGSEPEDTGSVAAVLHRGWINLKSALGGGDHAILAATESGEDHAVGVYERALKETLPAHLRVMIERQYHSIKQAHNKVKVLRDQLAE